MTNSSNDGPTIRRAPAPAKDRPREQALSSSMLARVFHQPSLLYFNAVARHSSVREAARQLNIAASAVTRQIAQLEDALGLSLFQRERQRLRLSPAGEILYRHARRLSLPLEAAVSELEMLRGIKTGTVRIGTVESVGLSFLPHLLSDFGTKYPRLHLDVSVSSSAEVIHQLTDERIDIGFAFIAEASSRYEVALRRDVPIGLVMSPKHPLADIPEITFKKAIAHPLAVTKPGISIRDVIEPFFRAAAPVSPPMVEANSIRMLVELALGGHYAAIMTPLGAQSQIRDGQLIFRSLTDEGLPTNRFGILLRSAANLSFAPAVFYEHAKLHFEEIDLPWSNGQSEGWSTFAGSKSD